MTLNCVLSQPWSDQFLWFSLSGYPHKGHWQARSLHTLLNVNLILSRKEQGRTQDFFGGGAPMFELIAAPFTPPPKKMRLI